MSDITSVIPAVYRSIFITSVSLYLFVRTSVAQALCGDLFDQAMEETMTDSVMSIAPASSQLYRSTRIGAGLGVAVASINIVWSLVVLTKNSNALAAHGSWMLSLFLSSIYLVLAWRFFFGARTIQQRLNCGLISLMYAFAMGIAVAGVMMMPKLNMSVTTVLIPFLANFFAFAFFIWDLSDQE